MWVISLSLHYNKQWNQLYISDYHTSACLLIWPVLVYRNMSEWGRAREKARLCAQQ